MAKVQNDLTRDPMPALILAGPRSGGTFLAHGLSNHPDIYCERQEVMHIDSSYRMAVPSLKAAEILEIVWGQPGYTVAACRLQYSQADYGRVWPLVKEREAKIIHLRRRDKMRQAVSLIINEMARDGSIPFHPQHARATPKRIAVMIEPERLKAMVARLIKQETFWQSQLFEARLPMISLTYRAIIGEGVISAQQVAPAAAKRVCEFLGVAYRGLPVGLRRVNPWRLEKMIANWSDIEPLMGAPEFKGGE
jgi:LPS sulfotransferase NodH